MINNVEIHCTFHLILMCFLYYEKNSQFKEAYFVAQTYVLLVLLADGLSTKRTGWSAPPALQAGWLG